MTEKRYFEDFVEGEVISSGPYPVSKEEIIAFASEFDPQPFHLDEEAAKLSPLGGLAASGWHTCSIFMRMMCDGFLKNTASQGSPGVENVKWHRPVRPGDVLIGSSTVLSKSTSKSRPDLGFIRLSHEVQNHKGETVMTLENTGMMGVRGPEHSEQ
ncbi:MAG: MaoC family dehydratase [Pseudomonadota bacterium]